MRKMGEGAETESLRIGRYVMGLLRSQLVPDLKMFVDTLNPRLYLTLMH